jgi:hypothetical protein
MSSVIKNIRSHQKVPVETLKRLLIISKLQHTKFELLIWELIIFTKFYHGKSGSVKIKYKGSCKKFVCSDALLFFRGRNCIG